MKRQAHSSRPSRQSIALHKDIAMRSEPLTVNPIVGVMKYMIREKKMNGGPILLAAVHT